MGQDKPLAMMAHSVSIHNFYAVYPIKYANGSIWDLLNSDFHSKITIPLQNDVIMSVMASQITSLTIVYSTIYSGSDQRKHQSFASLAFVWGIHWSQRVSNVANVSIWWHHHAKHNELGTNGHQLIDDLANTFFGNVPQSSVKKLSLAQVIVTEQVTNHYLSQWCLSSLMHICATMNPFDISQGFLSLSLKSCENSNYNNFCVNDPIVTILYISWHVQHCNMFYLSCRM